MVVHFIDYVEDLYFNLLNTFCRAGEKADDRGRRSNLILVQIPRAKRRSCIYTCNFGYRGHKLDPEDLGQALRR